MHQSYFEPFVTAPKKVRRPGNGLAKTYNRNFFFDKKYLASQKSIVCSFFNFRTSETVGVKMGTISELLNTL